MVRVVRRAVELAEVLLDVDERVVLAVPRQLVGLAAVTQGLHLRGDLIECLVPGDLLPLRVGPHGLVWIRALEGRFHPVGVVQLGDAGVALRAECAAFLATVLLGVAVEEIGRDVRVVGRIPVVRLDLGDDAIDDMREDPRLAAAHVAAGGDPVPGVATPLLLAGRIRRQDMLTGAEARSLLDLRSGDDCDGRHGRPFDEPAACVSRNSRPRICRCARRTARWLGHASGLLRGQEVLADTEEDQAEAQDPQAQEPLRNAREVID